MSEHPLKTYPTLGCCGLDCGLCPRYYSAGPSRCPGCCGPGFFDVSPGCGTITCCVKKKGLEVCAQCDEFPCSRFASWLDKWWREDSVVTHRKIRPNMDFIKERGLEEFLEQQARRIKLLEKMLDRYNDGRSKGFYCLASALLSIPALETSLSGAEHKVKADKVKAKDVKTKAKILRGFLDGFAAKEKVELRLRRKET
jgi:hypothetical protein